MINKDYFRGRRHNYKGDIFRFLPQDSSYYTSCAVCALQFSTSHNWRVLIQPEIKLKQLGFNHGVFCPYCANEFIENTNELVFKFTLDLI